MSTSGDCYEHRELLIDYYYRELDLRQRKRVADHLTSCSRCAVEYCRLLVDLGDLGDSLEAGPRPAIQAELRARVQREFSIPWWRRAAQLLSFPIPAYQTGMVVVVLLLLIWFFLGVPRPGNGGLPAAPSRATPVLKGYDASKIVPLDPNTL
jgi:anti-sigma factor RsiW